MSLFDFLRWLEEWASGGDDPSGPWPATDEEKFLNLWP